MRCLVTVVVLIGCSGGGGCNGKGGGATTPQPLTAKDIVQKSSPAIVRVEVGNDRTGTGFIIDPRGIVATNLHVVAGSADIKVKLHDGVQYQVQQIVGFDPIRDLALLRIKPNKPLPTLKLGDSDRMTAGDTIYAIGNPLGVFDYSVSNGLVSARRPLCGPDEIAAQKCQHELTLLQISAPISQGSSGGPLFNQLGEVVGITTAIISSGQNINLAVPTNYLKPMIARPSQMEMADFETKTKALFAGDTPPEDPEGPVPARKVPEHPLAVWDGCKQEDIEDTVRKISEAIEIGAPLYNQKTAKGFEACYRVYEGTSIKLEKDGACKGVRSAAGEGLLRTATITSYRDKAWALRDMFDGLAKVAEKWCAADAKCRAKVRPHP